MNDCSAAVVTAHNQPLEIHRVPIPDPLEPGALLVKITASSFAAPMCTAGMVRCGTAIRCRSSRDMSRAAPSKRSTATAPIFWESR
jgi:Zn-dependent alcohol dehydrogenase